MTGMSIRVNRDGRWQSAEVDSLTDSELEAWAARMRDATPADGWAWAVAMAKWIRDHVRERAGDGLRAE